MPWNPFQYLPLVKGNQLIVDSPVIPFHKMEDRDSVFVSSDVQADIGNVRNAVYHYNSSHRETRFHTRIGEHEGKSGIWVFRLDDRKEYEINDNRAEGRRMDCPDFSQLRPGQSMDVPYAGRDPRSVWQVVRRYKKKHPGIVLRCHECEEYLRVWRLDGMTQDPQDHVELPVRFYYGRLDRLRVMESMMIPAKTDIKRKRSNLYKYFYRARKKGQDKRFSVEIFEEGLLVCRTQ